MAASITHTQRLGRRAFDALEHQHADDHGEGNGCSPADDDLLEHGDIQLAVLAHQPAHHAHANDRAHQAVRRGDGQAEHRAREHGDGSAHLDGEGARRSELCDFASNCLDRPVAQQRDPNDEAARTKEQHPRVDLGRCGDVATGGSHQDGSERADRVAEVVATMRKGNGRESWPRG
eukprot:scaffold92390_cov51-Phaeocystis_antarctica.AAC.1